MQFTAKDIEEFRVIWRRVYGVELTDAEAREHAARVVSVYAAIRIALVRRETEPT